MTRPIGAREIKYGAHSRCTRNRATRRDRVAGPLARPIGAPLAREIKNGALGKIRTPDPQIRSFEINANIDKHTIPPSVTFRRISR